MTVLQISVHFHPNMGGVETHLNDLVHALVKRDWKVVVLTYRPLTAKAKWRIYENEKNLEIFRIPWLPNLFYQLKSLPIFEFVYLLPGLFLVTPFMITLRNPQVIHAHGLVAGFVSVFWGKFFRKKIIISTHSIYQFPKKGLYANFASWIFKNANLCLGLSDQAVKEIKSLGIQKVERFSYWVNLERFKKISKAKEKLSWKNKFIVLFVGRLIIEKGLIELLEAAKIWNKNINLMILGTGPLESMIKRTSLKFKNIKFVGQMTQNQLPLYYSASDVLIVPSISEEGFGRVIIEALACGTPVIGSNRGAIPEAIDETVGRLIDIRSQNIKKEVEFLFNNPKELKKLSSNCRALAERRYSEKNADKIIKNYS